LGKSNFDRLNAIFMLVVQHADSKYVRAPVKASGYVETKKGQFGKELP